MTPLVIQLPAQEDQNAFNLKRWDELIADSELGRELARVRGRIETDRHGRIIIYPPPGFSHGNFQSEIAYLLRTHLPHGKVATECPISTADGVKGADVVWVSPERLREIGGAQCLSAAPEISVGVISPSNTRRELSEKKALYFAAGAREVWLCDESGKMIFYHEPDCTGEASSLVCPAFPNHLTF